MGKFLALKVALMIYYCCNVDNSLSTTGTDDFIYFFSYKSYLLYTITTVEIFELLIHYIIVTIYILIALYGRKY